MRRAAFLAACLAASPAAAQLVHRGVGRDGMVTQTIAYVDAWAEGVSGGARDGVQDVLTRVERRKHDGESVEAHLLLHGPWGLHGYAFTEVEILPARPEATGRRTSWRAVDVDEDGNKDLLFIERTVRTRLSLDENGLESDPLVADHATSVRYLARESGSLVEHDVEMDPQAPVPKLLLSLELPGAEMPLLHLLAGDAEFARQRFEQAAYRYRLVREWAEQQLSSGDVARLSLNTPVLRPDPDVPEAVWIAATRRLGSLPRWYQKHAP